MRRFAEGLDADTKSDPIKIEQAFKDFCGPAVGKDERFVSVNTRKLRIYGV